MKKKSNVEKLLEYEISLKKLEEELMKLKVADKEQEVLIKNLTEDLKQSQMEITRMKEEEKNYKQLTKNLKAHLNSLNKPNRSALRKVLTTGASLEY